MLTCDVTPTASGGANERAADLLVRWTDSTHYWMVHLTAAGAAIQLVEVNGGTVTVRASQSYAFSSGTNYSITVTASGATIAVAVNGVQKLSYSGATSNQTATKAGLRLGAAGTTTACTWDNFVVTELV